MYVSRRKSSLGAPVKLIRIIRSVWICFTVESGCAEYEWHHQEDRRACSRRVMFTWCRSNFKLFLMEPLEIQRKIYIHFSLIAPVKGSCCKQKYRANIIHHFIFVFFRYFFHCSSCRKDQFTVLILKIGTLKKPIWPWLKPYLTSKRDRSKTGGLKIKHVQHTWP